MSARTAIPRLVVASKNPDKILEIESVLVGEGLVEEIVRGLSWPDVEETEPTLEGNALLKARAVAAAHFKSSSTTVDEWEPGHVASQRRAPVVRARRRSP